MQELEKILEEIEKRIEKAKKVIVDHPQDKLDEIANDTAEAFIEAYKECKDIIRKLINAGWIPVEKELPEVFGKYWATIRYDDGRISEPVVVDFRGVKKKYVVDTPNGREYETWGIDSAFHGSRVIAWMKYYIPEPYRPERSKK